MKQKITSLKTLVKNVSQRTTKVMIALTAIVGFVTPYIPVTRTSAQTPSGPTKRVIVQYSQEAQVLGANTESTIQSTLSGYIQKEPYKFKHLPFGIYEVDSNGEQSLNNSSLVDSVFESSFYKTTANLPLPAIGANPVDNSFSDTNTTTVYDGTGYAVAIMDTGVYKSHTALTGKVLYEGCFGTNQVYINATVTSDCPGAADYLLSTTDAALPCDATVDSGCGHGTHVAGIAAMADVNYDTDGDSTDDLLSGVAKGASIIALKVFSNINSVSICDVNEPTYPDCQRTTTEDQLEAIDYLIDLSATVDIAAVNMSLGGGPYASSFAECESESSPGEYQALKTAFANLRAVGIAPVVSTGNEGSVEQQPNLGLSTLYPENVDKIASPACIEGAIPVGATNTSGNAMAYYSNNGPLTSLLAPGGSLAELAVNAPTLALDSMVWSAFPPFDDYPIPGSGVGTSEPHATNSEIAGQQGTSMAAPHVAGAFAVLRNKHPDASVDSLVSLLQATGVDVTDARPGYTVGAKKRISLTSALTASTVPTVDTLTGPSGTVNEGSTINLTLATTDASSCAMDNGIGNVATSGTIAVPAYASITATCTGTYGDTDTATWTADSLNARPTKPNGEVQMTLTSDTTARTGTVSWSASTDTDGIAEYRIYLDGTQIATTSSTSYTYTDLSLDQTYTVAVYAADTLGAVSLPSTRSMLLSSGAAPTTPATGLLNIFSGMNTNVVLSFGAMFSTAAFVYFGKRRLF